MDRSNSFICLKYSLISVNVVGICVGFAGFVTGLARPDLLLKSHVSGAQLTIASVLTIWISIIGLIAALRHHFILLLMYAGLILSSLFIRLLWTLSSYWHKGESFFLDFNPASTIMTVIIELLIIIFAFLMAHATRIYEHERKLTYISNNGA